MLHKIFRASNKVWNAMYYDELLDTDDFQISYLKEADRLYFNAAHALASASSEILDTIEFYFKQRSMQPGVYLDPANPTALEETLLQRGYSLAEEEEENWYVLECNKASLEDFETKIKEFQIKNLNPYKSRNPGLSARDEFFQRFEGCLSKSDSP